MKHVQMQLDGSGQFFKVVAEASHSQVAVMTLGADESVGGPDNVHNSSEQWLYVVSGVGKAVVAGERVDLAAGSILLIEAGEGHEIINTGDEPLRTVNVYAPPEY